MTSNFSGFEPDSIPTNSEFENLESDSFEILSAYIDGELSPVEKQQVQAWLDQDPKIKNLYTKLLSLQRQIQHSVVPPNQKSIEEITAGVFHTINVDRYRHRRRLIFGTSAISAPVLAAITGTFSGNSSVQLANTDSPSTISPVTMLAVAVNKPAINIPKMASDKSLGLESP